MDPTKKILGGLENGAELIKRLKPKLEKSSSEIRSSTQKTTN